MRSIINNSCRGSRHPLSCSIGKEGVILYSWEKALKGTCELKFQRSYCLFEVEPYWCPCTFLFKTLGQWFTSTQRWDFEGSWPLMVESKITETGGRELIFLFIVKKSLTELPVLGPCIVLWRSGCQFSLPQIRNLSVSVIGECGAQSWSCSDLHPLWSWSPVGRWEDAGASCRELLAWLWLGGVVGRGTPRREPWILPTGGWGKSPALKPPPSLLSPKALYLQIELFHTAFK